MLSWALQVATCVCAFSIDILILKSDFVASCCGFVAGITLPLESYSFSHVNDSGNANLAFASRYIALRK